MKRQPIKFYIALSTLLPACVIGGGVVLAQSAPAPPALGGTLEQRVAQRKVEQAISLDETDQKRLASRCVVVQGKIRSLNQKVSPAIASRTETYLQIDAKLWIAIGQLKLAGQDTLNLEKQRSELAAQVAAFVDSAGHLTQVLDDIQVMNCQADVTGFMSLIETARIYHIEARAKAEGMRKYVIDDIKTTLGTYASDLRPETDQPEEEIE